MSDDTVMCKAADLEGVALDWAVRELLYVENPNAMEEGFYLIEPSGFGLGESGYSPSTKWKDGGALLERYDVLLTSTNDGGWACYSHSKGSCCAFGGHPLVALCRLVIMSEMGIEVEVPEAIRRLSGSTITPI